ncbi:MAG: TAXI family TRAP transporter solute-binding subunit, partial [Bacteroidota bacterium]
GLGDYRLFSFDNVEQFGRGSLAVAISLKFPQMKPFIIPQRTYGSLTEEAVVTIATDAVLITRGDLDDDVIYNITKAIFQHKERFTSISPLIYLDLKENFDRTRLNFPLHNGARIYLDRDEPTIFERYAELIGVIFSILVTLVSSGLYLSKWQAQRKKDRVDIFYQDIMDIKNELSGLSSTGQVAQRIKKLKDSQNKAFKMLIDEELRADESFRIYMELSKETIQELTARYKRLKTVSN